MQKSPPNSWIKPVPWWHRFKFQLLLFSIVMSVFPLTVLAWYNVNAMRENLLTTVTNHHEQSVIQVANDLSSLIKDLQHGLGIFVATEGQRLLTLPPEEQAIQLYAAMTHLPDVQGLAVFTGNGSEVAQVSRLQVFGPSKASLELTASESKALQEGRVYIGPVKLDQYKQPIFQLFIPFVHKLDSQTNGGIFATVSLRNIVDSISSISTGQGGYIFLVDEQGRLIGHEDFSQVLNGRDVSKSLPSAEMLERAKVSGKPITRMYFSYTGQQVIGSYSAVSDTNWTVIAEEPLVVALMPLQRLIRTFALAAGVLILVVLGVNLIFGRRLSFALDILKNGILRVASGEVGYVISADHRGEIGQVIMAFNHSSQELYRKRQMEAVIAQADRMASVGILAAGVAHEVNNPLATISVSVEDLLDRLKTESVNDLYQSGELATYLEAVQEQAQRCAGITGGLLDFARQREDEICSVRIEDLISKTIGFLRYRLKKQNIQLNLQIAPNLPRVETDRSGILQVLFNLCLNALQAMPPGGTLTIKVDVLEDELRLNMSDTGSGIAPEHLPHIFDPFFTTKKPGKGTGLGLSVCYGIITRVGGRINVNSRLNRGTEVNIMLPLEITGIQQNEKDSDEL